MAETQLGHVIARREFDHGTGKVVLEIGAPYPVDEGKTWFCPYRIIGLGWDKVKRAGGVDAVQALYGAMMIAATDLYCSDAAREGKLMWLDQRNLGLPTLDSIADLVAPEHE